MFTIFYHNIKIIINNFGISIIKIYNFNIIFSFLFINFSILNIINNYIIFFFYSTI